MPSRWLSTALLHRLSSLDELGQQDAIRKNGHDYELHKREAEAEPASPTLPEEHGIADAAHLLDTGGNNWEIAAIEARRAIVHTLFDAICVDVHAGQIREYRPKAALQRLLTTLDEASLGDPDGDRGPDCQH